MERLIKLYVEAAGGLSRLQSSCLQMVRRYRGWQFAQTGRGKMHDIAKIPAFFTSLSIPFPSFDADFISGFEFNGGILLILGLGARLVGLLLAANMFMADWTADREALGSILSDSGKFHVADPCNFLFASLIVLIFGAGFLSIDHIIARRGKGQA